MRLRTRPTWRKRLLAAIQASGPGYIWSKKFRRIKLTPAKGKAPGRLTMKALMRSTISLIRRSIGNLNFLFFLFAHRVGFKGRQQPFR